MVAQLQTSSTDLQGKYKELVDSIKSTGAVAADKQTLATNNELGKRGISNDSGLYQQEQANASLPVQSAIMSQLAQTGMSEQGDLAQLALEIARLQAGDVPSAISGALNYGGQVTSANQFNQDLAFRQAQSIRDEDYRTKTLAASNQPQNPYVTLGEGSTLYDLLNNKALYTAPKTYKATTGSGSPTQSLDDIFNNTA